MSTSSTLAPGSVTHFASEQPTPKPGASALPLPLASFEHYMLADDREDYPMAPFVRLTFNGEMEQQRLLQAFQSTLAQHPLLHAHVQGSVLGRTSELFWQDADKREPHIDWDEPDAPLSFPNGRHVDLSTETGLRTWVRCGSGKTELWFQGHHACCDLLGFQGFIEDLLKAYHGSVLKPRNQELLHHRGDVKYSLRQLFAWTPRALRTLFTFYTRDIARLGSAVPNNSNEGDTFPPFHSCFLDPPEIQGLRRTANKSSSTVNDLLLCDLYLTLGRWMKNKQDVPGNQTVRIGIPLNLRKTSDRGMSAANRMGLIFLDRRLKRLDDPGNLLRGIRRETRAIKRWNMGLATLMLFNWAGRLRKGMVGLLPRRCLASTIFSNGGAIFRKTQLPTQDQCVVAHNVRLESIEVIPALRPETDANFIVVSYAGRLNLCMSYAPRALSQQDSRRLFDAFIEQVRRTANS